jgi:hypothetical protein
MSSDSPAAILYDPQGNPVHIGLFGSLHVANPYTLADHNFKYDIDSSVWGTLTATGGALTHLPNESAVRLSVNGTNASRAVLRSHTFYRYQSGKSLTTKMSVYHTDTGQSNQIRRWGLFDDSDGTFWELNGTTLRVVRRTSTSGSPVDNAVAQSSWNKDKLDGTGSSGITLDITKGNIFEVEFQWFGVGPIRYRVNGILVHEEVNENLLAVPYMKTAVLPMEYEIVNTGSSSSSGFTAICATVIVNGGQDAPDLSFGAYNASDVSVTTTERPVLSIRPKTTFNGLTNRMTVLPKCLSISTEGSRAGYRVVIGHTLTGASWTSVDSTSGVEYDVSATAFTGGSTVIRGFLANSNDSSGVISCEGLFSQHGRKLHLDAFGSIQPIISIFAINEAAGTTLMKASLAWVEIR